MIDNNIVSRTLSDGSDFKIKVTYKPNRDLADLPDIIVLRGGLYEMVCPVLEITIRGKNYKLDVYDDHGFNTGDMYPLFRAGLSTYHSTYFGNNTFTLDDGSLIKNIIGDFYNFANNKSRYQKLIANILAPMATTCVIKKEDVLTNNTVLRFKISKSENRSIRWVESCPQCDKFMQLCNSLHLEPDWCALDCAVFTIDLYPGYEDLYTAGIEIVIHDKLIDEFYDILSKMKIYEVSFDQYAGVYGKIMNKLQEDYIDFYNRYPKL